MPYIPRLKSRVLRHIINKSLILKLQAEDYGQNYKLSDYNLSQLNPFYDYLSHYKYNETDIKHVRHDVDLLKRRETIPDYNTLLDCQLHSVANELDIAVTLHDDTIMFHIK